MIIEAKHIKAAHYVFKFYLRGLLKKNFSNFFLSNLPPEPPKEKTVILAPNHISWWDGFFIYSFNDTVLKKKLFVMMLREELERYWFFKFIGAYSIKPDNPASTSKTLKYTQHLFEDESNAIVFYPQGEIESFEKKPLKLNKGLQLFTKNAEEKCVILPVAFKIQHYNKKYPAIVFRSGKYIKVSEIQDNFDSFKKEFCNNVDALNESAFSQSFVTDLFKRE
jgi:1-acyl-sn-glycerol-3-phosphate acyltransferase